MAAVGRPRAPWHGRQVPDAGALYQLAAAKGRRNGGGGGACRIDRARKARGEMEALANDQVIVSFHAVVDLRNALLWLRVRR